VVLTAPVLGHLEHVGGSAVHLTGLLHLVRSTGQKKRQNTVNTDQHTFSPYSDTMTGGGKHHLFDSMKENLGITVLCVVVMGI
jgi:hypothetical protein